MVLISFDIDGTLEVGDPPGAIPLALVRRARQLGYVVGSASDRVISDQTRLWAMHAVEMDFIAHKHNLDDIKARFSDATRCIHIGDGQADEYYARMYGFEFHWVHELPDEGSEGWVF